MRIAVIWSHECSGGAGAAANRLCRGLEKLPGCEVHRFVEWREEANSEAMQFSDAGRVRRAVRDTASWFGCSGSETLVSWEQKRNLKGLLLHLGWSKPDVISLHGFNRWTRPGLPRAAVLKLARLAPVTWTLHDLWPLTGSSDFAGDQVDEALHRGANTEDGKTLRSLGSQLTWVGPSQWMAGLARSAYGSDNPCAMIPYGLDTETFSPMDRAAARTVWNLPEDGFVIAAVSYRLSDPRKGIDVLLNAAAGLERPVHLLLAGRMEKSMPVPDGLHLHLVDPVEDPRLLRTLYAAADLVAVPSREDNLPNVMLESMACGTPVAGSDIGGIPDAVRPDETGWLAPPGDVDAWRQCLEDARRELEQDGGDGWSRRCCDRAEKQYSMKAQAEGYLTLFREIVSRQGGERS